MVWQEVNMKKFSYSEKEVCKVTPVNGVVGIFLNFISVCCGSSKKARLRSKRC